MKETSPQHLVSEWTWWRSPNLFPAMVFVDVSRGKHYHLSSFHCSSSIMALAVWNSSSSLLCLWTEWLKVQGFVFKGSFNTAEHPAILHPRTRRVRAQPGEQRGAVVFQWTPSLRHHGHIWEEAKNKEEVELGWLKTSGNKMKPERTGREEERERRLGGGGYGWHSDDSDLKLTGADEGEEEEMPDRNLQFISLLMVFIIINIQEIIFPHSDDPPSISQPLSRCPNVPRGPGIVLFIYKSIGGAMWCIISVRKLYHLSQSIVTMSAAPLAASIAHHSVTMDALRTQHEWVSLLPVKAALWLIKTKVFDFPRFKVLDGFHTEHVQYRLQPATQLTSF